MTINQGNSLKLGSLVTTIQSQPSAMAMDPSRFWPIGPIWWFFSGVDIIFPQTKGLHQLLQILFLFLPSMQPKVSVHCLHSNYKVIFLKTYLKLNLNHCFMVKVKFRLCGNVDASRKWITKILCHIKETQKFRIYDLAEAKHYFYKLWFFSLNRRQKAYMNRKLCTHEVEVITSWKCITQFLKMEHAKHHYCLFGMWPQYQII